MAVPEPRYLALVFTAVSVAGSVWAMSRRHPRSVVAACMVGGLVGLLAFSLYSL